MFGKFQQIHLRLEVEANTPTIRESLLNTDKLRQWLFPQQLSPGLPEKLTPDLNFTSWIGPIPVQHHVQIVGENCLRILLSQAIDGYHEWYWGDGWIQFRLEGISLLPVSLGQTFSLLRLHQFLQQTTITSNDQ